MKTAFLVCMLLAFAFSATDQVLTPQNSDDILDHLEGNNWNIYILFFAAASPCEEVATRNNNAVEAGLKTLLSDNPELFYAKIDHTNPNFQKLVARTGVHAAPSVYMMVHGKGVWIYEGTSKLILDRLDDFLPAFKEASASHKAPYES